MKAFCHSYDLGRPIEPEYLASKITHPIDVVEDLPRDNTSYQELYKRLHQLISTDFTRYSLIYYPSRVEEDGYIYKYYILY